MLKNNVKIAWRALLKRKLYSFINIIGLSLGTTLCLLVFTYVKHENSRDEFHQKTDRLFMIQKIGYQTDSPKTDKGIFDIKPDEGFYKVAWLPFLTTKKLFEQIPEFAQRTRLSGEEEITVINRGEPFSAKANYVDRNFLELFTFPLRHGNPETVLDRPDKVVLTREMSVKYFGQENPVGEYMEFYNSDSTARTLFEVGGVLEKIPSNSSLKFNFLFPIENLGAYRYAQQYRFDHRVSLFAHLPENADVRSIHEKLAGFVKKEYEGREKAIKERRGLSDNTPIERYQLINLSDIYYQTKVGESSHPLYALILIGIALVVLLIGCINYISISIASSSSRLTEMGVRKVVGASTRQVFSQVYIEMLVIALISGLLSYTLAQALLPYFNELTGVSIELTNKDSLRLLYFMLTFSVLVSLLAGLYPALKLSKFRAIMSLGGRKTYKASPHLMRGLVVVQFSLCILFLSLGTVMQRQFSFISEKDLGFHKEALVQVGNAKGISEKLKQQLLQLPAVKSVSASTGIFAKGTITNGFRMNGVDYKTRAVYGDGDLFETFGIELLQGRILDPTTFGEDANNQNCLVNETFWNLLQQDPEFDGSIMGTKKIVGVVKDFHFEPLTMEIENMVFWSSKSDHSTIFVSLEPTMLSEGIRSMERLWNNMVPERVYDLQFMSDTLEEKYKSQKQWNDIIKVISLIGVFIACMGLFGLSGINVMNRTKEIGIRKVLGANFRSIIYLLNRPVILVILISCAIAFPVANYFMGLWLDNFAYKISITYDVFLIAGLISMIVVLITIAFHSIKTSRINPATLLRDE